MFIKPPGYFLRNLPARFGKEFLRGGGGPGPEPFNPEDLFSDGETGFWPGGFDPSDAGRFMGSAAGIRYILTAPVPDGPVNVVQSLVGNVTSYRNIEDWYEWTSTGNLVVDGTNISTVNPTNVTTDVRPVNVSSVAGLSVWVKFHIIAATSYFTVVIRESSVTVPQNLEGTDVTVLSHSIPSPGWSWLRFYNVGSWEVDLLEYATNPALCAAAPNAPARPLLREAGGKFHVEADGVDEEMLIDLPSGTYTRAWVTPDGDVTIEGGVSISGPENILRAAEISDVLYVDRALTPGEAAGLTAKWEALYG